MMSNVDLPAFIHEINTRLEKLEQLFNTSPAPTEHNDTSIGDYLRLKHTPKTSFEKAMIIAYFLEKVRKKSPFTMDELRQGFVEAKEPIPKNPSDIIYSAEKKGLMMKVTNKKNEGFFPIVLTNSGEKFVEELAVIS